MDSLRLLFTPRGLIAAAGLFSFGLVIGGVGLAQTLNLAACPLCILQRMVYLLLALEAGLALAFLNQRGALRLAALAMALTASLGAGIAAYQTWLQRFPSGIGCTAGQPWWEELVIWAGQQAPLLFEATGSCSEAGWKLLGLSIAEWSLLCFSALLAIALRAALLRRGAGADS